MDRTLRSVLRIEANICQSRIWSTFWAALIGDACPRGGPESILGFVVDKVTLGQIVFQSPSAWEPSQKVSAVSEMRGVG